jgi:hypothetical protein
MSDLICPYCEKEVKPDEDCCEQDTPYEKECEFCEKSFIYFIDYDPCYTEKKAPCLNGEEHDFQPIIGYPSEYFKNKMRCSFCSEERDFLEARNEQA